VTAIVTSETWKKSPAKLFTGSLKPTKLFMTLLHWISSDLMIALTNPSERSRLRLFATVNASNTEQIFFASSLALPAAKSTKALPAGSAAVQKTRLWETPASQEWKPRGLPGKPDGFAAGRLSSHINVSVPLWTRPSTPTNTPVMNRQSVWKP
jgi:hypothetical protein